MKHTVEYASEHLAPWSRSLVWLALRKPIELKFSVFDYQRINFTYKNMKTFAKASIKKQHFKEQKKSLKKV